MRYSRSDSPHPVVTIAVKLLRRAWRLLRHRLYPWVMETPKRRRSAAGVAAVAVVVFIVLIAAGGEKKKKEVAIEAPPPNPLFDPAVNPALSTPEALSSEELRDFLQRIEQTRNDLAALEDQLDELRSLMNRLDAKAPRDALWQRLIKGQGFKDPELPILYSQTVGKQQGIFHRFDLAVREMGGDAFFKVAGIRVAAAQVYAMGGQPNLGDRPAVAAIGGVARMGLEAMEKSLPRARACYARMKAEFPEHGNWDFDWQK